MTEPEKIHAKVDSTDAVFLYSLDGQAFFDQLQELHPTLALIDEEEFAVLHARTIADEGRPVGQAGESWGMSWVIPLQP